MASKKDARTIDAIIDEVEELDLKRFPNAWRELDVLSGQTEIDAIRVDPSGVSVEGADFRGVANVYVVLAYTGSEEGFPAGEEPFTTSDAFRGMFKGHLDEKGQVVVDEFSVDTSPFFAGEEMV